MGVTARKIELTKRLKSKLVLPGEMEREAEDRLMKPELALFAIRRQQVNVSKQTSGPGAGHKVCNAASQCQGVRCDGKSEMRKERILLSRVSSYDHRLSGHLAGSLPGALSGCLSL